MNVIMIVLMHCKLLQSKANYLLRRCWANTFVVCCLTLAFIPNESFADNLLFKSSQVDNEETQLTKRFAERESIEAPFEYGLSVGYRRDRLSWSIADGAANVASAVRWNATGIAQIRADAKLNLRSGWLLRSSLSTGAVKSGDNRDSDYAASNYTQEFSRSNNQTGGAVHDFNIGLGRKIRIPDLKIKAMPYVLYVVPLAGLSINQQSFTMIDGHQTIPANGAFPNLNNSYDTQWKSAWLGMDGLINVNEKLTLTGTGEYHFADYSAEANWNLRSDFAHPVSFKHIAKGRGKVATAGVVYRINKNLLINTTLGYQSWRTSAGVDQTYFVNGASSNYQLNRVGWNSWTLFVGGGYQF